MHSSDTTNMKHDSAIISVIAALVRHRLILGAGMIVTIAAIVVLYVVLPSFGRLPFAGSEKFTAQARVLLTPYSLEARRTMDFELHYWIANDFRSDDAARAAAESAGLSDSNLVESTVRYDSRARTIDVLVSSSDRNLAQSYLSALISTVRDRARNRANAAIEGSLQSLETATDDLTRQLDAIIRRNLGSVVASVGADRSTVDSALSSNSDLLLQYLRLAVDNIALEQALADPRLPWPEDVSIAVSRDEPESLFADRRRGAALMVLMGLVISVLVVFVLDYIRYVRSSDTEMEKIRSAINRE